MTVQELAVEIRRLSLQDRLVLLDVLTSSLHEEFTPPARGESSAERLHGILKSDDLEHDGDYDSDAYTKYLMEKYT